MLLIAACEKDSNSLEGNADIMKFIPEKCYCCWGWIIQTDDKLIKSDDERIGELVGYEISDPVKVYVELGDPEIFCSEMNYENPDYRIDYYEIKRIKIVDRE